jgi:hypothetical protein
MTHQHDKSHDRRWGQLEIVVSLPLQHVVALIGSMKVRLCALNMQDQLLLAWLLVGLSLQWLVMIEKEVIAT